MVEDLHGNAPDECNVALVLVDVINAFEFPESDSMFDAALSAAKRVVALKERARAHRIPVVYANDNFGRWRSDFRAQLNHCKKQTGPVSEIASMLEPDKLDYYVLKAKLSGFYETSLSLLLHHLRAKTLVLCGFATDRCVLATALDAHLRDYALFVPSDCSAAETLEMHSQALALMARVADANVGPSDVLDLSTLLTKAKRL